MRISFFLVFALSTQINLESIAQDERFIRKFFAKKKVTSTSDGRYVNHLSFKDKTYFYDLDGDQIEEGIQKEIYDGKLRVNLLSNFGALIKFIEFETQGSLPDLYKIKIHELSEKDRLIVFYVYEGEIKGEEFYGITNLYFGVFPKENIAQIKLTKGPAVWLEHEQKSRYLQRIHQIRVEDLDRDGRKEVHVYKSGSTISRVIKL